MSQQTNKIKMKTFTRVRSAKDILISSILLVAGVALIFIPTSVSVSIFGCIMVFIGLILLIVLKTAYRDNGSGALYSKKERFFAQSYKDSIIKALTNKCIDSIDLSQEDKGNGLRLDIYYSPKGQSFIQVHEYIPYTYEPATDFFIYETAAVKTLIK